MAVDPDIEPLRPYLERIDAALGGFAGKHVLEIGPDGRHQLLRGIEALYEPASLVGFNPGFPAVELSPVARTVQQDARDTGLPEGSIDAVYASAVFEHVHGLDEVLAEMFRIMVPGGMLFSHFGPIWSTSYGHHLWFVEGEHTITYHDVLLPAWCHLLSDHETVRSMAEPHLGGQLAARLADFVFDSDEQNRLFFDDYERIVRECPFETVVFKGYDAPDLADKYPDAWDPAVLDELGRRYPGRTGWHFDGITILLRKPAA